MDRSQGIVILGAGGHAKVVADLCSSLGIPIEGYVAPLNGRRKDFSSGRRFLGEEDSVLADLGSDVGFAPGFAGAKDLVRRLTHCERLLEAGFHSPPLMHPRSHVCPSSQVQAGAQVLAGAIVQPDCQVERFCIMNTGAQVDHDSLLKAGAHIGPGAVICGGVTVGRAAFIGAGSVVREGVTIGDGAFVAMGSRVLVDLPDGSRLIP